MEEDESLSKLSPFLAGRCLQGKINSLKTVKQLQRGDLLVQIDKEIYSDRLSYMTNLAGVSVTVSPHKTLTLQMAFYAVLSLHEWTTRN